MPSSNSLFWRILIFCCIITAFLLILFSNHNFEDFLDITHIIIIITILFVVIVAISWLISTQYIQPIRKISSQIENSDELNRFFLRSQNLPKEIWQLFKSLIAYVEKNQQKQLGLQEDQVRFNSILHNMSDGILITDVNGIISLVNQSAISLFQIQEKKTNGRMMVEVFRNHHLNELLSQVVSIKQQSAMSFENPLTKTYIHCIATLLDPDLPGSILFLFQDLTRTRQLEIIRRDFVSNVSHELRTPLTSLKLITETLLSGAMDNRDDAKKFIQTMENEVDNLNQLVEELLELSKIESGRIPLNKKIIKPSEIIASSVERMKLQADRSGIIINHDEGAEVPEILIDQSKIEQVLVNLIHNSIKFSPPGTEIRVSVRRADGDVVFSVEDNGIGIPPKDLDRIFERFYKTDPSRTRGGTGLGLSIARHLVELHKGSIWVESEPGKGSIFSFSIPANSS